MFKSSKKSLKEYLSHNSHINKTNSNLARLNKVYQSSQKDSITRYQSQNIKSMSTLPSKNYLQTIGTPVKRNIHLDNESNESDHKKYPYENVKNLSKSDKQLPKFNKNLNEYQYCRKPNIYERFYGSKRELLAKKSGFSIKSKQLQKNTHIDNNPQKSVNKAQYPRIQEIDMISSSKISQNTQKSSQKHYKQQNQILQEQNFKLRSTLLDYKLKQRDQMDEINKLETLCIKLQNFINKQDIKNKNNKEEQQYLRVVRSTFMDCFGLDNFKTIWTQQKRILKEWMAYKKIYSSPFQTINEENQSHKRDIKLGSSSRQAENEKQEIKIRIKSLSGGIE